MALNFGVSRVSILLGSIDDLWTLLALTEAGEEEVRRSRRKRRRAEHPCGPQLAAAAGGRTRTLSHSLAGHGPANTHTHIHFHTHTNTHTQPDTLLIIHTIGARKLESADGEFEYFISFIQFSYLPCHRHLHHQIWRIIIMVQCMCHMISVFSVSV